MPLLAELIFLLVVPVVALTVIRVIVKHLLHHAQVRRLELLRPIVLSVD
jgi:hypothetical protein